MIPKFNLSQLSAQQERHQYSIYLSDFLSGFFPIPPNRVEVSYIWTGNSLFRSQKEAQQKRPIAMWSPNLPEGTSLKYEVTSLDARTREEYATFQLYPQHTQLGLFKGQSFIEVVPINKKFAKGFKLLGRDLSGSPILKTDDDLILRFVIHRKTLGRFHLR